MLREPPPPRTGADDTLRGSHAYSRLPTCVYFQSRPRVSLVDGVGSFVALTWLCLPFMLATRTRPSLRPSGDWICLVFSQSGSVRGSVPSVGSALEGFCELGGNGGLNAMLLLLSSRLLATYSHLLTIIPSLSHTILSCPCSLVCLFVCRAVFKLCCFVVPVVYVSARFVPLLPADGLIRCV